MEAAIMDGKSLRAGAVSGLNRVKNPIKLARMIMEKSEYLFLHGGGAEKFALENSLSFESDEYFFTDKSYQQLQKAKLVKVNAKGTVGAVAIDSQGNLASATSTGGTSNKSYGRIGDSPIIGAGTYANTICAVSCTGEGEYFIRAVAAHLINSLLEFHNFSLHQACEFLILNKIKHMGGEGGVIAIDKEGNLEMIFNSEGMYRGYRIQNQEPRTFIY
jgi:beta-aspartyl-peptidase (threonine type)